MSAEVAFNQALLESERVTHFVGSGKRAKIYPAYKPQDIEPPAVVFSREQTDPEMTIHGTVAVDQVTIGCICIGESRALVHDLAKAVVEAAAKRQFVPINRLSEYDEESEQHLSLMTFTYWEC